MVQCGKKQGAYGLVFNRILLAITAISLGILLSGLGSKSKVTSLRNDTPTCSDIIKIFEWSRKNHGFADTELKEPSLPKKVAVLFSEKLDPHYVLFTSSEINQLSQQVVGNWKSLLEQSNCSVFQSWFQRYFKSARRRIDLKASNWLKSKSSTSRSNPSKASSVKYHAFSADLKDLGQRQEAFFENIFSDKEKTLFFKDYLNDVLFPTPLDTETALAKAMLGVLDSYSTYFSDSEFSDFYEELSGKSAGVGITVEKSPKGLKITEVASKSPAELAGIKSGDQITEVDGKSLGKLGFRECTQLLKGEDQTEIQLKVESKNGETNKKLRRTTQVFEDKRVALEKIEKRLGKKIAMVSIPSFYGRGGMGGENGEERSSSEDLRSELEKLERQGPLSALILDLRGNPGGYLEEAISMAGFFLGPKAVVGVKDKEELRALKADSVTEPLYTGPLVVWVDEETASAGEVLAAALKDYQRAILVGTPNTFGKGSVQKLIRLNDPFLNLKLDKETGVLKLTTSLFFSPLGHSPANHGVEAHISLPSMIKKTEEGQRKTKQIKIEDVEPLLSVSELEQINEKKMDFQQALTQLKEQELNESQPVTTQVFGIADQLAEINSF